MMRTEVRVSPNGGSWNRLIIRIVDVEGKPVSGAMVTVAGVGRSGQPGWGEVVVHGLTDNEGAVESEQNWMMPENADLSIDVSKVGWGHTHMQYSASGMAVEIKITLKGNDYLLR